MKKKFVIAIGVILGIILSVFMHFTVLAKPEQSDNLYIFGIIIILIGAIICWNYKRFAMFGVESQYRFWNIRYDIHYAENGALAGSVALIEVGIYIVIESIMFN